MVEFALRAVDVLGCFLFTRKVAACPSLDEVGAAADGDGHTVVELAVTASVLRGHDVEFLQQVKVDTLAFHPFHEGLSAWGIADAHVADVLQVVVAGGGTLAVLLRPAFATVVLCFLVQFQLADEPIVHLLGDHVHRLAFRLAGDFLCRPFALIDFNVGAFGQSAYCFGIVAALGLHHPLEHVAAFVAAEAVVGLLGGTDVERACLLGVERAAAHHTLTLGLQLHLLANQLHDVCGLRYPVDVNF